MKKIIYLVLLITANNLYAQNGKVAPGTGDEDFPLCPLGMCASSYIYIETFNFHKPRTNCTSGFGLCIRYGAGIRCYYCDKKTSLNGTKVTAWVNMIKDKAELHLPLAIKEDKEFVNTDLSVFEVEDKMVSFTSKDGLEKWVKGGIYPVSKTTTDLVITLDMQH